MDATLAATADTKQALFDDAVAELGEQAPTYPDSLAVAVWLHLRDRPHRLSILDATRLARGTH